MATAKQIAANRLNARKSTGPRTAAGKARSSRNAVKHGMCARMTAGPDERGAAYERWLRAFREELRPITPWQQTLFPRIANLAWRSQRVRDVENRFLRIERRKFQLGGGEDLSAAEILARKFSDESMGRAVLLLNRYERSLDNAMLKLLREFHRTDPASPASSSPERTLSNPRKATEMCDADAEIEKTFDRCIMLISKPTQMRHEAKS